MQLAPDCCRIIVFPSGTCMHTAWNLCSRAFQSIIKPHFYNLCRCLWILAGCCHQRNSQWLLNSSRSNNEVSFSSIYTWQWSFVSAVCIALLLLVLRFGSCVAFCLLYSIEWHFTHRENVNIKRKIFTIYNEEHGWRTMNTCRNLTILKA